MTSEMITSRLCFVDLAGSEKTSKLDTERNGEFRESCLINNSLLHLGRCLKSLKDGKNIGIVRDSNLTMLLLGFMNENNSVAMLCNIRQDHDSLEETVKVLQYASDSNRTVLGKNMNMVTNLSNGSQTQSSLGENRLQPYRVDCTQKMIQGVKEKIKLEEFNKKMQSFRASMFKEIEETSRQSMRILENSRSSTYGCNLMGFRAAGKENEPPGCLTHELEESFFTKAVNLSDQKTPQVFKNKKIKWG